MSEAVLDWQDLTSMILGLLHFFQFDWVVQNISTRPWSERARKVCEEKLFFLFKRRNRSILRQLWSIWKETFPPYQMFQLILCGFFCSVCLCLLWMIQYCSPLVHFGLLFEDWTGSIFICSLLWLLRQGFSGDSFSLPNIYFSYLVYIFDLHGLCLTAVTLDSI